MPRALAAPREHERGAESGHSSRSPHGRAPRGRAPVLSQIARRDGTSVRDPQCRGPPSTDGWHPRWEPRQRRESRQSQRQWPQSLPKAPQTLRQRWFPSSRTPSVFRRQDAVGREAGHLACHEAHAARSGSVTTPSMSPDCCPAHRQPRRLPVVGSIELMMQREHRQTPHSRRSDFAPAGSDLQQAADCEGEQAPTRGKADGQLWSVPPWRVR